MAEFPCWQMTVDAYDWLTALNLLILDDLGHFGIEISKADQPSTTLMLFKHTVRTYICGSRALRGTSFFALAV